MFYLDRLLPISRYENKLRSDLKTSNGTNSPKTEMPQQKRNQDYGPANQLIQSPTLSIS